MALDDTTHQRAGLPVSEPAIAGASGAAVATRGGIERTATHFQSIVIVVYALVLANSLLLIWWHRFFPLNDFPDWVYQGYVLSRLARGHPLPGYRILSYPMPDSLLTPLLGLFDLAFRPEISGKIVLSIEVLSFLAASVSLLSALGVSKRNPIVLVPLAYIFSFWFLCGNIAWLFGFAGYCWYCAYIIRRYETPAAIRVTVIWVASCGLFLTHIAPWFAAGLFTCVMAAAMPLRVGLRKLLLPFFPSGILAIWSLVGQIRTGGLAAHARWIFWTAHQFAGAVVGAFSVFIGFLPWVDFGGPLMHGAALANFFATMAFIAMLPVSWVCWHRGERRHTPVLVAATVIAAAVIGVGEAYGIFSGAGGRLIYPAAWLVLCWSAPLLEGRKIQIALTAALCSLLIVQTAYLDFFVTKVARAMQITYAAMRDAHTRDGFCGIYESLFRSSFPKPHRHGLAVFFPTGMPAVRLQYYLYIERDAAAPINPVGILRREADGDFNNACAASAIGPGLGGSTNSASNRLPLRLRIESTEKPRAGEHRLEHALMDRDRISGTSGRASARLTNETQAEYAGDVGCDR